MLFDEEGTVLAEAESSDSEYGPLTLWLANRFFRHAIEARRELFVSVGDDLRNVGMMKVVLAPAHTAERFITVAAPALFVGLAQALSIGLVLLWLSSRLVTRPLHRAAVSIANMDPELPEAMVLEIPASHQENELGYLLGHTNGILERLIQVQEKLRLLATHDSLTGLPNRMIIASRLERAIARARRSDKRVAVLFLDLDDFKSVNDSYGHTAGDELLIEVTHRLRSTLRTNDSVGRLGGDEFLMILDDISSVDEVEASVRRIVASLSRPFTLSTSEARTSSSIGIALFPEDGKDVHELMRNADLAMYKSKKESGNRWYFFAEEMEQLVRSNHRMSAELRQAMANNEFELFFQPKISAAEGVVAGCEALLRWRSADKLVTAEKFIRAAEETGVIVDLGGWVLEQACAQVRAWTERFGPTSVAINVSALQLREPEFATRVLGAVERYEIDPGLLELEITETVLIRELSNTFVPLVRLRDAGLTISIDDFGTGYSSLAYLNRLPASHLKIDKSFVSGPQRSEVILEMIIGMAKALRLGIVAEGVETESQRDWLVAKGCNFLQGYLYSEPISARQFEENFLGVVA